MSLVEHCLASIELLPFSLAEISGCAVHIVVFGGAIGLGTEAGRLWVRFPMGVMHVFH